MNLKEIVLDYLITNGYDGLSMDMCGCDLDDLMPCDAPSSECLPARLHTWEDCPMRDIEGCQYGATEDECSGCYFAEED